MFIRKVSFLVMCAAVAVVTLLGVLGWNQAQASSLPVAETATLQATQPMTGTDHTGHTMPAGAPMQPGDVMTGTDHTGHNMPEVNTDPHAGHTMPTAGASNAVTPPTASGGMGPMMAQMADMQGMMARMQRLMADDMMNDATPMSPEMRQTMGEMMDMMGEMQGMMADMQGMMAGEMGKGMGANGMSGMGQMQGQQMGGGMMGQMPMMGTMIMVMPMPMMQGGMMQNGMMGQMPMMQGGMMQGMDMGGMMGGQGGAQGNGPAAGQPTNAAAAPQTGKLGEIEVKVTPPDLTNIQGETIDFTVDLNATGTDLSFDLAPLATLIIGDHTMPAQAWEVTLDHGHHVAGVLKFPAHMQGAVEGATIVFADPAGGEDVSLTWTPAQ